MSITPDPVTLEILGAAGFTIRPHPDRRSWVVTHSDTGQQVEGDSPANVTRVALRALRERVRQAIEDERRAARTTANLAAAARQKYGGVAAMVRAANEGDPLAAALLAANISSQE